MAVRSITEGMDLGLAKLGIRVSDIMPIWVKTDLAKVLMQATAEPYLEGGQIVGFKMSQIDADSSYDKAGLRDEDVVTAINGQELNSVGGSIALLKSLKGTDELDITIRRGGDTLDFNISVQ